MATTYYKIPTLNSANNINLVNDINSMMTAIDTALHDISSGENPELEQLQTTVSSLQSTVTKLQRTIGTYIKITTYGDLDKFGAITTKEA